MDDIYIKLDEIINLIKNCEKTENIILLKEKIYNDEILKEDLDYFHKIMENPYSSEYTEIKRKILNNELVKEYKNLEKELFVLVLEINKRLNELIDKNRCVL